MAEAPRLFVSHSSRDADLTRDVCDRLRAAGYDVLVDYAELKPGVDWPRHLHEYMARCHGALLLLTKDALDSPWVLKEATILTWRHCLDPAFKVLPVCVPGVTDAMLEAAKYGPLMLGLVQKIGSTAPDAIVQAVKDGIGVPNAHAPTPYDRLVGRLSDLLAHVGDSTLKDIAETIRVQPPAWRPELDVRSQYVQEIARGILSENMGGFQGIHQLIDTLSYTPSPANVKQVFGIVWSYWVDAQAAGRLPQLKLLPKPHAAALNGARVSEFTALAYVRRAHPLSRLHQIVPIAGGGGGNVLAHVESQICAWLREQHGEAGSNDNLVADLAASEQTLYAVLPGPIDHASLALILDRFPTIGFIVWTGEGLDRDSSLTRVEWLEPVLEIARERDAYQSHKEALRILKQIESTSL